MDMWTDKVKIVDLFVVKTQIKENVHCPYAITHLQISILKQATHVNYLGVTAHYILILIEDDSASLQSRALKLLALDSEDGPKDANFIHNQFNAILHEFDLYDHSHQIVFVTDRGKNIVNSLDGYDRNSCMDHFINNIVEHVCEEVGSLKSNVSRIVKYLKVTGKASALSRHIVSSPATRWSYVFDMFDAFHAVFNEIRSKIPDDREDLIGRYNSINKTTLKAVRDFLEIFKDLIKEVEGDTYVTAVKILPVFESLHQHLITKNNDVTIIKKMKATGMKYFNENKHQVLPTECENWVFFHPQYKKLQNFKTIDTDTVMANIQMKVEAMLEASDINEIINNNVTTENANISTNSNDTSKRSVLSDFEDCEREQNSIENAVLNEIDHYKNSKIGKVTDVLQWWMKNKSVYPHLWRYFMTFAAIPASSAAAERLFSLTLNTTNGKRNRLRGNLVDMLVFLNKNKKYL